MFKYTKPPSKAADPKGRAKSAMGPLTCLRCGAIGHKALNCPQPPSTRPTISTATSGAVKRQTVEGMALESEIEAGLLIFEGSSGMERADCAMVDLGASTLLLGFGPFKRYLEHLKSFGFDESQLTFHRVDRTFHFDGDNKTICSWAIKIPVFIDYKFGYI